MGVRRLAVANGPNIFQMLLVDVNAVLKVVCVLFVDYYREHVESQSTMLTTPRRSLSTRGPSADHVTSLQYRRLVSQPLFWASVVSMLLAVVCTVTIVVLCLVSTKRRTRACARWSRGRQSEATNQHSKLTASGDDDEDVNRKLSLTDINSE